MVLKEPVPFFVDDVVQLRKPHPCGSYLWTVVRVGADIGITCNTCGRRVLLPRRTIEKRLKQFVSRGAAHARAQADAVATLTDQGHE